MYTGKTAKFFSYLLPALYRRCPMENTHVIWDHYCNCCPGNPFRYLPTQRVWIHDPQAAIEGDFGSSYSYSTMLSAGEIVWSVLQQALILAAIAGGILYCGLHMIINSAEQAKVNISKQQNWAASE